MGNGRLSGSTGPVNGALSAALAVPASGRASAASTGSMSDRLSAASAGSAGDSSQALPLDSLRVHHTQALVNIVDRALDPDPIDAARLGAALVELRRHLESPRSSAHGHPATETSAAAVAERLLLCWVCARAAQADAHNYDMNRVVETADRQLDRFAAIPEAVVSEAIQCVSYLATMGVGAAAVARTSIPVSLVLALALTGSAGVHTCALRALTKLCTKHSVRRVRAGARWEAETGLHAVLDALARAQAALGLRSRFDPVANQAHSFAAEVAAAAALPTPPPQPQPQPQPGPEPRAAAERAVASALAFVNALVDAHPTAPERLRVRKDLLDTPLCDAMQMLDGPSVDCPRAAAEMRHFRRAYRDDIRACDPQHGLCAAGDSADKD
ncbi:hypothetical protein H4R18_005354 [Coemansia javaensis]|uniref:Uncharacterized protein n=1 Tax=Coemansia javaensis TaxID=2761396 RepID=A0A9W8H3F2_9FUNG|nr:hypothetical protein H4R18_005354 [Coemansia javaensis]